MRVDGFRFDLATILAREPYGFDEGGGFLDACRQDPVLSSVKADRRALGYRPGRIPGRSVPAGMGRMERQVSRYGTFLLEGG
jgi:glycogen operon protein